jgi:hypothetical protein
MILNLRELSDEMVHLLAQRDPQQTNERRNEQAD